MGLLICRRPPPPSSRKASRQNGGHTRRVLSLSPWPDHRRPKSERTAAQPLGNSLGAASNSRPYLTIISTKVLGVKKRLDLRARVARPLGVVGGVEIYAGALGDYRLEPRARLPPRLAGDGPD